MKPSETRNPWRRLAAAARRAEDGHDDAAPYGFATRVAALAMAQPRQTRSLLDRFALRAVAIASLLALASIAANYSWLRSATAPATAAGSSVQFTPVEDPVTVLLDA